MLCIRQARTSYEPAERVCQVWVGGTALSFESSCGCFGCVITRVRR